MPSLNAQPAGTLTGRHRLPSHVTGNRSLDEFAPNERAAEPPSTPEAAVDPAEEAEDDGEEVELFIPTFGWSPDGAPCGACGAVVERRWREGDDLVCDSCKAW